MFQVVGQLSLVLIPLVSLPWVGPGYWAKVVVLIFAAAVHSSLATAGDLVLVRSRVSVLGMSGFAPGGGGGSGADLGK